MQTQLDITSIVAVIGAITGVLALALQLATFRRDNPQVKVSITSGVIIDEHSTSDLMMWVEAVNTGRRPIQIVGAGMITDDAPRERLAMFGDLRTLPKVLAEGDVVKVRATFDSVVKNSIASHRGVPKIGYVQDSTGREYRTRVPKGIRDALVRHAKGAGVEI